MSQHLHEFNLTDRTLLYPVPMTVRVQIYNKQIIFEFPDAILSVQSTEERIGIIIHELVEKGYVTGAMPAQLMDRNTNPGL